MFTALYQIAKNTFREALREPIYLLVLLSSLALIGFYPILAMFVFRIQERLVVDSGMATILLFGWGIAVLISSYSVSREIDNGTALLLMSKPVRRPVFIVAKILGIIAAVSVFWFINSVATLISLRVATDQFWIDMPMFYMYYGAILLALAIAGIHNYVMRSSFPMMAVLTLCVILPLVAVVGAFLKNGGEKIELGWYIVPGMLLILFSIWSMAALATTLSTRFNLASNLLICTVLFLLGLMSDYFLGRFAREPWYDTVPAGTETLWMCKYSFAPTEVDVKRWSRPEKAESLEQFRVWSAREKPAGLPKLGAQPFDVWQDGEGWKLKPSDLDAAPLFMAEYNATKQTWETIRIQNERSTVKAGEKMPRFTAYAFRRSNNPPRVPTGGSWSNPIPDGGSYLATAAYAIVPNWQLFWVADAMGAKIAVPVSYVLYGFAYSVILVAFLAVLAVMLFGDREVGAQQSSMS